MTKLRIPGVLELAGVIHDAADAASDFRDRCSWTRANAAALAVTLIANLPLRQQLPRQERRSGLRLVDTQLAGKPVAKALNLDQAIEVDVPLARA